MKRLLTALLTTVALAGCVEENSPQRCEGKADFVVSLSSLTEMFPNDTRIEVTFGGGSTEMYWLGAANDPEVLFCETTSATSPSLGEGGAAGASSSAPEAGAGGAHRGAGGKSHAGAPSTNTIAGAGGSDSTSAIRSITCEVWSSGPATVTIRAANWRTTRELNPDPETCTLTESIVLGEPDPEP